MLLTLRDFRRQIDDTILQRGGEYYRKGLVAELEEAGDGNWSAQVDGTEPYSVEITQEENGALTWECSCPFDLGPVCKHVVAVLLAIEETFPEYRSVKPSKPRKKRQSREEKLLELLQDQSREELIALLLGASQQDRQLANLILVRSSAGGGDKKLHIRMVKDALKLGKGHDGFIDYWGSGRAAKGVRSVLGRAESFLNQGEPTSALPVLQAVIETLVPAMGQADDSNGELSGCIDRAFGLLDETIERLPPDRRVAVFDYCVSEARKERYVGWDWGWDLAQVAASFVQSSEQRTALFTTLDQMVVDRRSHREVIRAQVYPSPGDIDISDYDQERADEIKLSVIQRLSGRVAAEEFLQARIHFPRFRQELVRLNIARGSLPEAKRLCQEYLGRSSSILRGIAVQFQSLLLEIAQQESDAPTTVQIARALFLETSDFQYYELLRRLTPQNDWEDALGHLIRDLKGRHFELSVPEIYLREEKWEELLAVVQSGHAGIVEHYRKYLEPRFPAALCDVYERLAVNTLAEKVNRQGYQIACRYLRRINKLGEKERVSNLVRMLREKYRNRPALLEELSSV